MVTSPKKALWKIAQWATKQGVTVQMLDRIEPYQRSPFSRDCGIDWESKTLFMVDCLTHPGALLHELGHLLASKEWHDDEYSFFGWEYAVARELGLVTVWKASLTGYGVVYENGDLEFDDLTNNQQQEVLNERLERAMELGLLSPKGKPLCLR